MGTTTRILLALLLSAGLLVAGCGGDGDSSTGPSKEQLRKSEIESLAAYACMPAKQRSELRTLEARHNTRLRQLARKAGGPTGTTGPAGTTGEAFKRTVEADAVRSRLLAKARAIYNDFLPGGDKYDGGCFLREREKARKRIESLGS
jgi:hypothetical protein